MSNKTSIDLVNLQIDRERFRQARIFFYSATVVTAISVSVTLLGAGEMLIGNPQGAKTMLGGLHASVNSIRLVRSASDRVKKISDRSTK
jgi:hypothetical protein